MLAEKSRPRGFKTENTRPVVEGLGSLESFSALVRMAGGETVTVRIEDEPGKQAGHFRVPSQLPFNPVLGELVLNRLPEILVHDGIVLAGISRLLVNHLANKDLVLQEGIEGAPR